MMSVDLSKAEAAFGAGIFGFGPEADICTFEFIFE